MSLDIRVLSGPALEAALDDVAALRITVFRDWPYLYDGDLAYERRYLESYRDSPGAVLVGAFEGDRLVGASTGAPLEDHAADFGAAFAARDIPLTDVFYCAASALLPNYRGNVVGHAVFDARERHAMTMGRAQSAFCFVIRPKDHPLRPATYRPLDAFWEKRGYRPAPGLVERFAWKDVDQPGETEKDLQFWMRYL